MTRHDIPYIIVMLAMVLLFTLFTSRYSRANPALPGGVTCEQIVQYAKMLGIPNTTWGRAQARIIAATFGIVITDAQLAEARKCLADRKI